MKKILQAYNKSPLVANRRARITNNKEFANEIMLLQGKSIVTSDRPSIIHFSVNKAATQYVKEILAKCVAQNNMLHIRMNEYAFFSNLPYLDHLNEIGMQNYQHVFQSKGFLYSVFGGFVEGIENLKQYKIILMLRDPRDVLVSSFYSKAYSHPLPGDSFKAKKFMKDREFAINKGIDKYVLSKCDEVKKYYERYISLLVNRYPCLVVKYEDMISDFRTWLEVILDYSELTISDELKNELIDKAKKSKNLKENQLSHKRQLFPGDYLRKLDTNTTSYLNESLSNILLYFNYS